MLLLAAIASHSSSFSHWSTINFSFLFSIWVLNSMVVCDCCGSSTSSLYTRVILDSKDSGEKL